MKNTTGKSLFTPEEAEITPYNTADYLQNDEDRAGFLEACLEEGGPDLFLLGLGDVIKSKGIRRLAKETGLTQAILSNVGSPGQKPPFDAVWKITKALGIPLGFPLSAVAAAEKPRSAERRSTERRPKRETAMA